MKKILIISIVVLLAAGIGYRAWYGAIDDRPQFRTLPVTRGDLMIGVSATGSVEPVQIIDVARKSWEWSNASGPTPTGRARPSTTIPASGKATCSPSSTTCPTRPNWIRPRPACGWPRPSSRKLRAPGEGGTRPPSGREAARHELGGRFRSRHVAIRDRRGRVGHERGQG